MTEPPIPAQLPGPPLRTEMRIDRPPSSVATNTQARASRNRSDFRSRIPTVRELASLMINGILSLPPRYFRGMYLDVLV